MKHFSSLGQVTIKVFVWILASLIGIFPTYSFAQEVKGTVTDGKTGESLIGARVVMKGAPRGAMTDENGKFSFKPGQEPPFSLVITYFGYDTLDYQVTSLDRSLKLQLNEVGYTVGEVEIVASAYSETQQRSPLTVESMSINAIKETPAANFYEGLGHLKGVDLTSASIGFKVINTRGFNSTQPVRSLQIIDGVDNQSPGLNFALGNFLGASELDVESVDLIVGASSAFYGPNAFNGVISMNTKSPFIHRGLSASVKVGERNLGEVALRYARAFTNEAGEDKFAFKINLSYLTVDDWEADNLDPVTDAEHGRDNPGGYDAVNRYGDENLSAGQNNATGLTDRALRPGLGRWYRTGYEEVDLVNYDTRNFKAGAALHFMVAPKVELIGASNFSTGTTVLQGDNRYSLNDILFFQHRLEVRQKDKFFVRAYVTHEDAGNSYDAVFTALRLQSGVYSKSDNDWGTDYRNHWNRNFVSAARNLPGMPAITFPYDYETTDAVLLANMDSLVRWHNATRAFADTSGFPRLIPGTAQFDSAFNKITSTPLRQGGTRLVDRSALYHVHGEYKFTLGRFDFTTGANGRLYTPVSDGNLFSDTLSFVIDTLEDGTPFIADSSRNPITNLEGGAYIGAQIELMDERLRLNATARIDKNQNFSAIPTFSVSSVYTANSKHTFRASFSAAVRNPTLADQYLFYDVGRATLLGNLDGFEGLADTASFTDFLEAPPLEKDTNNINFFDVAPIQPERVRTIELGYRTTLGERFYVDASYYFSWYQDFIGFNIGVDVDFPNGNFLIPSADVYRIAANAREIVTTQGVSVGLNYFFDKGYTVNGNYSWNVLNTDSDDPIIPAFNTPEHKFNIGFAGRDVTWGPLKHMGFSINYKWIEGFLFEGSPQFTGDIPTYDLLDVQVNKRVDKLKSTFKLGASNVLDKQQFQVYGGPRVGRLIYFSVTTELDNI
ncbi:MAG: carboxypeptidase-like regulatory domain-containing protein [Bacteroidota bacterium]